jgi:hypothetical protein
VNYRFRYLSSLYTHGVRHHPGWSPCTILPCCSDSGLVSCDDAADLVIYGEVAASARANVGQERVQAIPGITDPPLHAGRDHAVTVLEARKAGDRAHDGPAVAFLE